MNELASRLVAFQIRRPMVPLVLVGLITIFFGLHASRLTLRTRFDALLPQNAPSVIELKRLETRTNASQTVLVVLEGDRATLHAMGDDVVAALDALGPNVVSSADDGTLRARAFLAPRSALFLERADLERVAQQVDDRWNFEVQKEEGTLLDDDAPPPPLPTRESIQHSRSQDEIDRFPTGYFENEKGTALVVAAHSPIAAGDVPRMQSALEQIHAAVDRVRASKNFSPVRVSYAGDMPTGFAEYHVVLSDLLDVGAIGIALVLAVVVFYFLRVRAVLVMGVTILVGLIWTFGLTEVVIGHLNVATSFLVSIVAGNGINVGILYQSRYYEERAHGAAVNDALSRAVTATWQPTIIAAFAAAASYGSLLATDFRAFRDFGLIAATGMLVCWIVKTAMVPPLLVLLERVTPTHQVHVRLRPFVMAYGKPFAWLAPRAPRVVLAASVVIAIVGAYSAFRFATHDPIEGGTRTLENDPDAKNAELQRAWGICNAILGASQGAMIVATDTPSDARDLATVLRARWDAAPKDHKPFVAVHALSDFVPSDQAEKIPTAVALGDRLRRAHDRGFMSAHDWDALQEIIPPADLAAFTENDLPDAIARPFTEKNGTRGTLVLVEAAPGTSNDAKSLVAFADAYRKTTLPSGKIVEGSGSAVIFADMLAAIARDVPRAIFLSLALTVVVVLVTFHRDREALGVVAFALAVGTSALALYLSLSHTKINFLNFAALPVTFGIGVDYAINVTQRWRANGRNVVLALRTSGGAVVLCSLTTLLGYLALLGSHNRGIRSLGAIAAMGELTCLLAAVVSVPALLLVKSYGRAKTPA